jgi:hypothetical protein
MFLPNRKAKNFCKQHWTEKSPDGQNLLQARSEKAEPRHGNAQ